MNRPVTQANDLPTPTPATEPDNEPYWRAAGQGRLRITRCPECADFVWPPRPFCPAHMHAETEWADVSGRGVIYSYTEVFRGEGAYAKGSPFVLAYVELAEGPRVMTNIVGAAAGDLKIGMDVEVVFHAAEDGLGVPRFTPVRAGD